MKNALPVLTVIFSIFVSCARADVSDARNLDQGWHLWLDPKASWQNDALYLFELLVAHVIDDLRKTPISGAIGNEHEVLTIKPLSERVRGALIAEVTGSVAIFSVRREQGGSRRELWLDRVCCDLLSIACLAVVRLAPGVARV